MEGLVRAYRGSRDDRRARCRSDTPRGQGTRARAGSQATDGERVGARRASGGAESGGTAEELRNQIISQHLYLVQTVARKFAGLGESHEDLLQEGAMGLINAVELFDPERGVQFSTYATHLIEGQIRHYLRDRGKLIKQPAWVQELTTRIMKATETLTHELDRPPALEEIAARVGVSQETIGRMLEAQKRSRVASLDAVRTDDESPPEAGAVDSEKLRMDDPDEIHLPIEDRIFLREAISKLKTLERKVVHSFYYLDLNQTEIARRLGISVNYASYLLRGAVAKLKKAFEAQQEQLQMGAELAGSARSLSGAYSLSARPAPSDPLTKLATRDYLLDRLGQEVERARRYPQQFSLLLVAPDQELTEEQFVALARVLRTNVRSIDVVARMGEYHSQASAPPRPCLCLLLPHTGRETAVLAQRLVAAVSARAPLGGPSTPEEPAEGEGATASASVSIGYAVYPTDGRTSERLLSATAQALSEAQREGGARVVRAQPAANG
jgi:RNA polymerase sigma-B factor